MKNYFYLLLICLSTSSCYTYKTKAETEDKPKDTRDAQAKAPQLAESVSLSSQPNLDVKGARKASSSKANTSKQNPANIQEKLEANKYFKIEVGGKPYKLQVDKWESDTLVAHVIHKPKKILKFHKNQINEATIAERRFSQRTADIITVVAYAAAGVGIWALVK